MFNVVESNNGVTGITGFRGLGKSAIFALIYPVWRIIKGEKYVIYGAANIEQSAEKADFIRHEFDNNRRLMTDFPELKIVDTDDNVYFLQNRTKIRAVSIKQTIRGTINSRVAKRPGLIILDDIDEETNVGNITIGKRKMEKILHEIKGSLRADEGKVLWLGNLTHPNFAICQFKKLITDEISSNSPLAEGWTRSGRGVVSTSNSPSISDVASLSSATHSVNSPLAEGWTRSGRGVVSTSNSPSMSDVASLSSATHSVNSPLAEGWTRSGRGVVSTSKFLLTGLEKRLLQIPIERNEKSTWEQQYPTAILPKLKSEMGMTGYLREMMGQSLIDGVIFKAHWFISGHIPADKDMKQVHLYLDSAWGKKGCFRSVIAIGHDGLNYYVIKAWCRQCENNTMFEYLYSTFNELKQRFGHRVSFSYEANYGQTRIMTDFDQWVANKNLEPVSYYWKPIYNRENKNLRIESLEPVIQSGKIIFPAGQDMPTLIAQFTAYPQGYNDGPDALAGCMERFATFKRGKSVTVRGFTW
jgi:predicted phage terminase large subunit-like protein